MVWMDLQELEDYRVKLAYRAFRVLKVFRGLRVLLEALDLKA